MHARSDDEMVNASREKRDTADMQTDASHVRICTFDQDIITPFMHLLHASTTQLAWCKIISAPLCEHLLLAVLSSYLSGMHSHMSVCLSVFSGSIIRFSYLPFSPFIFSCKIEQNDDQEIY